MLRLTSTGDSPGTLPFFDSYYKLAVKMDEIDSVNLCKIVCVCCFRVPIRGGGECAYLSDSGISSGRGYTHRKWVCSKPKATLYKGQ